MQTSGTTLRNAYYITKGLWLSCIVTWQCFNSSSFVVVCHAEQSGILGAQCDPPLTQQCPAASMDRDQTRDERHTMENKGQVGAIRGVGERAVDSRASMTQNQSSVSGQTSQPLSAWGSVMQTWKKERTEQKYSCLFRLDYLLLLFPFSLWRQIEGRLLQWAELTPIINT